MGLREFIVELDASGRVKLDAPHPATLADALACDDLLRARAERCAAHEPGPAPLDLPVARWAAMTLHRACQCLVFRELDEETVRRDLTQPCPPCDDLAAACHSADLYFRHLPDVIALARGIAADDPLVAGLMALAQAWPLSSVGVPGIGPISIDAFANHPALRRLYVDRVLATADASRAADERVQAWLAEACGLYPELAGRLAGGLKGD